MEPILIDERDNIVFDISWHPSGEFIATVGADGFLKIFKRENQNKFSEICHIKRNLTVRRVEFSPDGTKLAAAGFDKLVYIYNFTPNEKDVLLKVGTLEGQDSEIKTARWSKDGKYIVTSSRDKTVYLYDLEIYDFIAVHSGHTADVKDAMISPNGKYIVSVSFDETVRVWETKEELGSLQIFSSHKGTVWSLAFSDKGSFITLGEDGKIILYDIIENDAENDSKQTNEEDKAYQIKKELLLQKPLEPLYSAFYMDGKWYVAGSLVNIYVVSDDLSEIERIIPVKQLGDINSIKPNPANHKEIAVANDDGSVVLVTI